MYIYLHSCLPTYTNQQTGIHEDGYLQSAYTLSHQPR